jgi:hypothetical protein
MSFKPTAREYQAIAGSYIEKAQQKLRHLDPGTDVAYYLEQGDAVGHLKRAIEALQASIDLSVRPTGGGGISGPDTIVKWYVQNDPTDWTPDPDAGSITIPDMFAIEPHSQADGDERARLAKIRSEVDAEARADDLEKAAPKFKPGDYVRVRADRDLGVKSLPKGMSVKQILDGGLVLCVWDYGRKANAFYPADLEMAPESKPPADDPIEPASFTIIEEGDIVRFGGAPGYEWRVLGFFGSHEDGSIDGYGSLHVYCRGADPSNRRVHRHEVTLIRKGEKVCTG